MARICGIDEAGKGPVFGDMVICGIMIDDSNNFDGLGVDSKSISPKKRAELFSIIEKKAHDYRLLNVSAEEIDLKNKMGCNLNTLECLKMAQIINELNPDIVFIDCPHPVPEKFKNEILSYLANKDIEIVAEHKADSKHSIVGAASILAKVTRDGMVKKIENECNVCVGSGYPSDPLTKKFVAEYLEGNHPEMKKFIRHSWSTIKNKLNEKSQSKLA